ncbi:hypothetical protein [Streptomyces gibsoniae]|uniref:Uncharacterized protein n=1 Tax=Streptomyces gibsoniae TaxID=3075529 RepID=A0ABU2TMR4_9ACTN|nr:hypothetical protein [Streptomyces sp. DSM 41699]MDT0462228.1 hypothetical protein [Streptomyces sp. DSM 41699]
MHGSVASYVHAGGAAHAFVAASLSAFAPPALGSYSAAHEDAQRAAEGVGTFPALPAGDPVDLSVTAFSSR